MNTIKKIISLALVLVMCASLAIPTFAATSTTAVIDYSKKGSVDLYKVDMTNAEKDGVWDNSYVSTGVFDAAAYNALIGGTRAGDTDTGSDLGNGETSNGYAIRGVEFTYLKVADIRTYSENENGASHVEVLYGINSVAGADLLSAIGLSSNDRYKPADPTDKSVQYYQSDVLTNALRVSLANNATTVKDKLEAYVKASHGTRMPLTDANGHTAASDLPLGLYLVVETKLPENVTNTCNPFFLSLPMTSVNGNNATNGGQEWLYHVTMMPKNETGLPTLEKTVREAKVDTGKNNGTSVITDGFAHTGTASAGDVLEFQIISTLPSITSTASHLTTYTVADTLEKGMTFTKGDVVLEWFTDANCTNKIASWDKSSGKFDVVYQPSSDRDDQDVMMTISMTEDGLREINTAKTVYTSGSEVRRGYSDCTVRITYTAKMDSNNTLVYGDAGNCNKVILTWKRTSESYYDVLVDDVHVYSYGIDLTKVFSGKDGNPAVDGDFSKVQFVIYNDTDKYWVKAELNAAEGVYYVVDHLPGTAGDNVGAGATKFVPVTSGTSVTDPTKGKVIIKGLEDDEYIITEVQTSNGYTLLKDHITVTIGNEETTAICDIYDTDVLGLIQNDPRYATIINTNVDTILGLKNLPQKHLEHHLLTASATVDGNAVTMLADNGSANAKAPLTVVNTHGFDLPQTGENGAAILPLVGIAMIALSAVALCIVMLPKRKEQ